MATEITESFYLLDAIEHLYREYSNNNYKNSQEVLHLHSLALKQCWTVSDRTEILEHLAHCLTISELTYSIAKYFSPILLDLLSLLTRHEDRLYLLLSRLVGHFTVATNYAYDQFNTGQMHSEAILKHLSDGNNPKQELREFFEASCVFLNFDCAFFTTFFDWSFITNYFTHEDVYISYLANHIYCNLLNLDSKMFTHTVMMSDEEKSRFQMRVFELTTTRVLTFCEQSIAYRQVDDSNRGYIYASDFTSNVISVSGVLLKRVKPQSCKVYTACDYVELPSLQCQLRTAALGVSLSKPVLVQGPMGSGKTSLIRRLASLTGRHQPPDIVTIQISDQVDSKYLLGSYVCSEVPGEFLFNLGPLLRAIQNGNWVILEDIDLSSPEVFSLITSIIDSKSVNCIAGCENKIDKYDSNFRLFLTHRKSAQNVGDVHNVTSMNLLAKYCLIIDLPELDLSEVKLLINSKWPDLVSIVPKICDIYNDLIITANENNSRRRITLRDLLKWCHRLVQYFSLNSEEVCKYAFLDAVDCFAKFSSGEALKNKALLLGTYLNITKDECNYLLTERTPNMVVSEQQLTIGRQTIQWEKRGNRAENTFAFTTQSLQLLERLFVCVNNAEPVLLCGETGVGKTSCIQYLAWFFGQPLTVINMNQQSDSVELFGGYKPVDVKYIMKSIREQYQKMFALTFDLDKNGPFLAKFARLYNNRDWQGLLQVIAHVSQKALHKCAQDKELFSQWTQLAENVQQMSKHLENKSELTFAFIEGALTRAVKEGHWVLLDEINLAEHETLQSLLAILEKDATLTLFEKVSHQLISVHPDFRIFACMNPATDVGKRDLPIGMRNRFTEFYINEITDKSQLRVLVHSYIGSLLVDRKMEENIVEFYNQVKHDAANKLKDLNGYRPVFSLRNLCRALRIASSNPFNSIHRSIYESFCLSFLSNLDHESYIVVKTQIEKIIFPKMKITNITNVPVEMADSGNYVLIDQCPYPIPKGSNEPHLDQSYIRTPMVNKNLQDICRIIFAGKTLPILLQGETSVGKTSLITWLAKATGNVCIRVNNHEHTDLQEYVGSYCSDAHGRIVFKEGLLAQAMRNGHWLILDELNLAPTEVLEALNRVLDDNRELFISETQQIIKAHPRFLLFATQNPPGRYGGRKVLSRAFRNRFIELHFSEIPSVELETILHLKCSLPLSYSKRMVSVLCELQRRRNQSDIFAGKHGLITLRDLFRWGYRYMKFVADQDSSITFFDWDKFLATQGYMLLAGRVRKSEEMLLIKQILEKTFRCSLSVEEMYYSNQLVNFSPIDEFSNIVWTKAFKRLGTLIEQAIKYQEPILLVGETGCGKTTICQYFAAKMQTQLRIINCHMNTESADFLGSLRPNRNLSNKTNEPLFEWVDGPLIRSMKEGNFLLIDEISLADDSVLERLNSVLEPERVIFLAENADNQLIEAANSFRYFATMNPGGDYGKKELSPALRDRFTEIWCPIYEDEQDIKQIIEHNLVLSSDDTKRLLANCICRFIIWFQESILNLKQSTFNIRDILSWVQFINKTHSDNGSLSLEEAFINGAHMVFVDSLGSCHTLTRNFHENLKTAWNQCREQLYSLTAQLPDYASKSFNVDCADMIQLTSWPFGIKSGKYLIECNSAASANFYWNSGGVQANLIRIVRALQLDKSILLEGPPGVGKTSLIQALAKRTGHNLIRINLSEQTDIADLFGCDLPVEGDDSAGKFAFREGPLLKALKSDSTWILLDELNLASQTVLEGLNACLDHRGEIFVPELNRTFYLDKAQNRIFASQNPFSMDGSRKGLPKSFVNRFTTVFIDNLREEDFIFILSNLYSALGMDLVTKMVHVNQRICSKVKQSSTFAKKGGPFEFNLRDLIRWAEVSTNSIHLFDRLAPELFFDLIYTNKMRTVEDRVQMKTICLEEFGFCKEEHHSIGFYVTNKTVQFGYAYLPRNNLLSLDNHQIYFIFDHHKEIIESALKCVEMNWMTILIGGASFGKTQLVKMLARLCGQQLNVLSVNSEMDTNDLLGGFEQKDLAIDLKELEDSVLATCYRWLRKMHHKNGQTINELILSLTSSFLANVWQLKQTTTRSMSMSDVLRSKAELLSSTLRLFVTFQAAEQSAQVLLNRLENFQMKLQNRKLANGTFEWRDSLLIKTIEKGEWLLIDNANLLNAAVLDRLNSLLETDGTLILNEKGSVDGELISIRAHHNFRLFLTMNPQHGELSRPMRNRGIEIVLTKPLDYEQQFVPLLNKFNLSGEPPNHHQFFNSDSTCTSVDFIIEKLLKSQHGFHSDQLKTSNTTSKQIITYAPPVMLNHVLTETSTFYATQDCHLCLSSLDDHTNVRLFLAENSVQDFPLRHLLLTTSHTNNCLDNKMDYGLMLTHHHNARSRLISSLRSLFGEHFASIEHFPVDFRENAILFEIVCNFLEFDSDRVNLWHQSLNRYQLYLLWAELLQRIFDHHHHHTVHDSLAFVGLSLSVNNEELNAKQYPSFILPIYQAVQIVENQIATQLLSEEVCIENFQLNTIRSKLLWCYQLLLCCHQTTGNDWDRFLSEHFFPIWFMFNETLVPLLADNNVQPLLAQVNCILNLDTMPFDSAKFELITQMSTNYCNFSTTQDIALFEQFLELNQQLLASVQSGHCIKQFNYISFEAAKQLANYFDPNKLWLSSSEDSSSQCCPDLTRLITLAKAQMDDGEIISSSNIQLDEGQISSIGTLFKSDLLISSLMCSSLLKMATATAEERENYQDEQTIVQQAEKCQFRPSLLMLFCHFILKKCSTTTTADLFWNLFDATNQMFNLSSIVDYFTVDDHQRQLLPSILQQHNDTKVLTGEMLPLLSVTCFNIYQIEHITMEQFFHKNFTLNFYMSFLCKNYVSLKKSHFTLVDHFYSFARLQHERLVQLNPKVVDKLVQELISIDCSLSNKNENQHMTNDNQYFHMVSVGFLLAYSTQPDFPIDPIIRDQAIRNHRVLDSSLLKQELTLRKQLYQHKYGFESNHFHSEALQCLATSLAEIEEELANQTNIPHKRLSTGAYFRLKADIAQFGGTILNWVHLKTLCNDLVRCMRKEKENTSTPESEVNRVIASSLNCQHSIKQFIQHISTSYRNYHDLTTNYLNGVCLILKGLQLATYSLQAVSNTSQWFASFGSLSDTRRVFGMFFKFINVHSPHEIGEFILQNDCIEKFVDVTVKLRMEEKNVVISLLKSVCLEIENSIVLGRKSVNNKSLLSLYLRIVHLFVEWWKDVKHKEELEKVKNESLFHMKLVDEEPNEKDIEAVFPSFEEKFEDLMMNDKFTDLAMNNNQAKHNTTNTNQLLEESGHSSLPMNLSKDTLLFIVRSHIRLLQMQSNDDDNVDVNVAVPDLVRPYFIRYQILADIFKKTFGFFSIDIERDLIDGHLLVNRHLAKLEQTCNDEKNEEEKTINVYQESTLAQARQCFDLLDRLRHKIVSELLPQFEDHPTLLKLVQIIERINKIEINSSLLSFATGLELLLKTGEDWQLIAHRGISLIEYLQQITELLVSWRKLEIKYWAHCLQSVTEKIEENELINWWFTLYTSLEEVVSAQSHNSDQSQNETIIQFISMVKKFFENSNLGQFDTRLKIVYSFICQLKHTTDHNDDEESTNAILIALLNLYNFYRQFSTQVTNAIQLERSPIEKEIKDFVTISKWNPNNFWSLKALLHKSHRQLYGYMRKFEMVLNKPANVLFVFDDNKTMMMTNDANSWRMTMVHNDDNVLPGEIMTSPNVFDQIAATTTAFQCQFPLLAGSKTYLLKSKKLCRKISDVRQTTSVHCINQMEEMNSDLISGIKQYSELKVVNNNECQKDIEKWKKAVGHIQNKKRRALSELFKQLTLYGFSFRKGLIKFESIQVNEMLCSIYPLPIVTTDLFFDQACQQNINSCNTYFYKFIANWMKFVQAIEKPHEQLTLDMLDRIKGFAAEITKLVIGRRKIISDSLRRFAIFEKLFTEVKVVAEQCNNDNNTAVVVPLRQMRTLFVEVQQFVTQLLSFVIRLKSVLECLDETNQRSSKIESTQIPLLDTTQHSLNVRLHLDKFVAIIAELQQILFESDLSRCSLYTVAHLHKLTAIVRRLSDLLQTVQNTLEQVEPKLSGIHAESIAHFEVEIAGIAFNVDELHHRITFQQASYMSMVKCDHQHESIQICHNIIKCILLCVENNFNLTTSNTNESNDNLIKQNDIFQAITHLNINKMNRLLDSFFTSINRDCMVKDGQVYYYLVCFLYPFMHQYMHLYRTSLCLAVGWLKCSSKLLHVLLSLFNELTTNGFCLPPEPSDNSTEQSQLKDLQNSGFGEGDTNEAKDVSDRLDCQDQLDELQKADCEQSQEEEESGEVEANEKGIEMDEDFEGKEFGDKKEETKEENDNDNDQEEEDEDVDDKMGDVDDDDEALDEKIWNDEEDEEEQDEPKNESEQTGGKDNFDSQIVANENNKNLDQDKNEKSEQKDDSVDEDQQDLADNDGFDEQQPNDEPDMCANDAQPKTPPEMQLPDNLNLDGDSDADQDEGDDEKMDTDNDNQVCSEEEEETEDAVDSTDMESLDNKNTEAIEQENETDQLDELTSLNVNTANDIPNEMTQYDQSQLGQNCNDTPMGEGVESNMNSDEQGTADYDQVSDQQNQLQNTIEDPIEQSVSKNKKNTRSLADDARSAKRQKIIDKKEKQKQAASSKKEQEEISIDAFRHVDDTNQADDLAYDIAMREDLKNQQQTNDPERGVQFAEEKEEQELESKGENDQPESQMKPKQVNHQPKQESTSFTEDSKPFEIEGELVATMNVARGDKSFFNIPKLEPPPNVGNNSEYTFDEQMLTEEMKQLDLSLIESYKECQLKVEPLVYELCGQLQLVLEPTKCAKFKGDYKSGKRLNMRKVIAYVASDFRKDKIWLRRSKPSKRQYQIIIAVDDSLSMDDNRSKQIAFESLLLLGKSLSIIESGALSVLSFGEQVKLLHRFDEPFTEQSAFKMFSNFHFNQTQTRIEQLLQNVITLFSNEQNTQRGAVRQNGDIYQLLLIVSDGRGISSQGNENLQRAVMRLKELSIFSVFLIIDNPSNNSSILDIRRPVFESNGTVRIVNYIETFPFPYYVILKDIAALPSILGEALRQWFELISYESY